ncbi:S8 family serine peptidase [Limnofasciculus baicalensis]|uniref:Fervidolysin-like N-terminal prodomain domain-containing protein n=1 Tax=Limnofasciculus baicalensis BBK-W-15 TaxID=2699891 RepID=A0AAE3GQM3_9CYAN|nr:hypothetical protein [Limnofasciculus baicalensis]MCP2728028.1 hypothetical protein [Limnofasciculus baicalensis BBK-W-15]
MKKSLGATVMETTTRLGIECWSIKGMTVAEAIAQYSQNPLIEYIEPNYVSCVVKASCHQATVTVLVQPFFFLALSTIYSHCIVFL